MPDVPQLRLIVSGGPGQGTSVPVVGRLSIGRAPENGLVLEGAYVSNRHALIVVGEGGAVEVHDLGSRNGTFVNGTRVEGATRLRGGEEIRIGDVILRLARMADKRPAPPATETTRYLCAAAYIDRQFTERVLSQVFDERHRAIAPSYGVDVASVAKHCLAAKRRNETRDVVLVLILIAGLALMWVIGGFAFWLMLLAGWGVVLADQYNRRHVLIARQLSRANFDPKHVDSPADPEDRERLAQLSRDEQEGNVTVYSGFVPFVGCGLDIGGWSFVVNVDRAPPDSDVLRPTSFRVDEIHDRVSDAMLDLGLPGLSVEDRVYVNGQDIRDDRRFLPDRFARPITIVPPDVVRRFLLDPTPTTRQYLTIRVLEWQGELVVSVFVRFTLTGKNLFTEASYFLLPSLQDDYHKVDEFNSSPTPRQIFQLGRASVGEALGSIVASPVRALRALLAPVSKESAERATRKAIRENPGFDYGATTSVRQSGTSANFRRYFQKLDKEMYLKIVERRLLDEIITFLAEKNVDISDLKERSNVIYNNGVIVSGGSVKAESMAVGHEARASVTGTLAKAATKVSGGGDR